MKIKKAIAAGCISLALMMAASPITVFANYDQAAADAEETEVVVVEGTEEEVEETDPLTPDGNLTLVDDIGDPDKAGKQFITLVTKNGNYFYLIIDRDDDGDETVHFLNQVDESDLLALMEDEDVEAYEEQLLTEAQQKEAAEKAAREAEEAANQPVVEEEPAENDAGVNPLPAVVLGLALLAGGGFYGYKLYTEKKRKEAEKPDPDADYVDNEEISGQEEEYVLPEDEGEEISDTDGEDEE